MSDETPKQERVVQRRRCVTLSPRVLRILDSAMSSNGEKNFSRAVGDVLLEAASARTPFFWEIAPKEDKK